MFRLRGGTTWASIRKEHEQAKKLKSLKTACYITMKSISCAAIWVGGVIVVAWFITEFLTS